MVELRLILAERTIFGRCLEYANKDIFWADTRILFQPLHDGLIYMACFIATLSPGDQ